MVWTGRRETPWFGGQETLTHRGLAEVPEPSFGLPLIDRLGAAFLVLLHAFSSVLRYRISGIIRKHGAQGKGGTARVANATRAESLCALQELDWVSE
jgi:hypothetical protein